jgi:hypothetical protein
MVVFVLARVGAVLRAVFNDRCLVLCMVVICFRNFSLLPHGGESLTLDSLWMDECHVDAVAFIARG